MSYSILHPSILGHLKRVHDQLSTWKIRKTILMGGWETGCNIYDCGMKLEKVGRKFGGLQYYHLLLHGHCWGLGSGGKREREVLFLHHPQQNNVREQHRRFSCCGSIGEWMAFPSLYKRRSSDASATCLVFGGGGNRETVRWPSDGPWLVGRRCGRIPCFTRCNHPQMNQNDDYLTNVCKVGGG